MQPRWLIFIVGAMGAVLTAVQAALANGVQIKAQHLLLVGFSALMTYALKWPGDLPKAEADELKKSLRPPGYDPKQEGDHEP